MCQVVPAQINSVIGCVLDQNGAAVTGATVTLSAVGLPAMDALTDSDGRFHFEDVPAAGRIRVSANGFAEYAGSWASTGEEIQIVLAPAAVNAQLTVTRTDSRLGETPASIVVLGGEELRATPALTLDDKLRQIPGFTLFRRSGSRSANPTSQGVSLRGNGGSGASRAAVFVDGIPLNDPFGGWIYWGRIPTASIEDIEVLRGAAGDLYGSSAIGGVIAISTRRTSEDPLLDLEMSYGNETSPFVSLFTAAGHGKWNASLAAEAFATDGFIIVAKDQRGAIDTPAGVKRSGFVPYLEYRFKNQNRVFGSGEYYEERRQNGTPLQTNDTKILSGRIGADANSKKFGSVTFRGWTASEIYHQSFSSIAASRNTETLTRSQTVPSDATGAYVQWSKSFSAKGAVFAGAETHLVRGSSDETAFAGGRATALVGAGGREFTFGAYAGGSYDPSPRVVLSGGVRFDRWREFSAYSATRSLTSGQFTRAAFLDRTESAASPRASVLVRINEKLSITGSFSTGFRQPTLNELYRSFRVGDVLTLANENLRAERAAGGEAGILASGYGNRLYLRAVAFCSEITRPVANVTLTVAPTLITRQRQNLGSTRVCGLEADSRMRVRNDLEISAGYLFTDARVKSFPVDRSLEGLRVPQTPRQQFTFGARYSDPKYVDLRVQLRAADAQFDDDQNLFRLAGFTTLDLFASRRLARGADLYFAAENIFDSTIEAGRTPVLTITGPRTFRAGLRIRLGKNNGK